MADHLQTLTESGWTRIGSISEAVLDAGLPLPDRAYLDKAFPAETWDICAERARALARHFADVRFADTTLFGPLLVPNPGYLDTRRPIGTAARAGQHEITRPDFVDDRIPAGVDICPASSPWLLVVTAISEAGLAMGSLDDIVTADAGRFTVHGTDTRDLMIRQIWGALTLQAGRRLPDSERRESWTFTLFPGEPLVDGQAISGTVLHGASRQRLGKTTRGIKSARVRPALTVGSAEP